MTITNVDTILRHRGDFYSRRPEATNIYLCHEETRDWLLHDPTVKSDLAASTTDAEIASMSEFLEAKMQYELDVTSPYIEEVLYELRDSMQYDASH
jgi:hypothetical protein